MNQKQIAPAWLYWDTPKIDVINQKQMDTAWLYCDEPETDRSRMAVPSVVPLAVAHTDYNAISAVATCRLKTRNRYTI